LLIQGFDPVSADGLERLVTIRGEVSPGLRFKEGLCFLKAVPFRDCHSLGWGRPLHADNLAAARAEITTACVRLFSLDALCEISSGLGINRFEFGDGVGFRLSLGMKPLNRDCADGDTGCDRSALD
jgi:hypothetical protein